MKVAIIGSRGLIIKNLQDYIPPETTEIVSGSAVGVDSCAKKFAIQNNIKYTEFLPQYKLYGRAAPLKRNLQIIDYADIVLAFWDGKSTGTLYVVKQCQKTGREIEVILKNN